MIEWQLIASVMAMRISKRNLIIDFVVQHARQACAGVCVCVECVCSFCKYSVVQACVYPTQREITIKRVWILLKIATCNYFMGTYVKQSAIIFSCYI